MCYKFQYSTLGSHLIRQNLAYAEFEDVTLNYNNPEQLEQGIKLISEWGV